MASSLGRHAFRRALVRTTENIEVDGSHFGLGWNPAVLSIVADRLSQPEGGWKRYEERGGSR